VDDLGELVGLNRLGDVIVHAAFEAGFAVAADGVGVAENQNELRITEGGVGGLACRLRPDQLFDFQTRDPLLVFHIYGGYALLPRPMEDYP
jgi:hypothetical protein